MHFTAFYVYRPWNPLHVTSCTRPAGCSLFAERLLRNVRQDVRYTFFLFNDLLLYASTRFGKLNVHRRLPLATLRLVDVPERGLMARRTRNVTAENTLQHMMEYTMHFTAFYT